MKFVEFKLPEDIGILSNRKYFISYILSDYNGFRIVFKKDNSKEEGDFGIVFDFGYFVEDYRVSREGRRLDHHMSKLPKECIFVEVEDSEYLKKLNNESDGMLLFIDPDLKHYITGDDDYSIDIISREEPEVYKEIYN